LIPLLLLLAMLQSGPPATGPAASPGETDDPTVTRIRGADLGLLDAVRGIAVRVEELRGQPFTRPPIAVRVSDDMRGVAAEIRALNVLPRERLAARGRAWGDLGLGQESSPAVLYKALAADLAGIGFDPSGNRLLVAPDRLTEADFAPESEGGVPATVLLMTGVRVDEPVVAHLLMHVRQRERLGHDWLAETTDAALARSAWAEGEANLLAVRYLFSGLGVADDVLQEDLDPADLIEGRLVPAALGTLPDVEAALVRFVYREGFAAAVRAYRGGQWTAVEQALAGQATTRELLHPERPRPAAATFPTPQLAAARGLSLIDEDSLGQHAIFVLIAALTGKDNLGLQAADGWVGDRLYRWEREDSPDAAGVTLWATRWRDEQAAKDFDYAIVRALESRFPGRPLVVLDDGQRVLQTPRRLIRLTRQAGEVRLVVAAREFDSLTLDAPDAGS
jgi:hypothetical protein